MPLARGPSVPKRQNTSRNAPKTSNYVPKRPENVKLRTETSRKRKIMSRNVPTTSKRGGFDLIQIIYFFGGEGGKPINNCMALGGGG